VAVVILAAGNSTRMGSCKALIPLAGRPLIEHVLSSAFVRRLGEAIVVLGHEAEQIRPVAERFRCRCVLNPDPDRGRTGSVQAGLAVLGPEILAAFIQPVDCPLIREETYLALIDALGHAQVAIPCHQGAHGHPPLMSRAVFPRILAAGPEELLRDLLHSSAIQRAFVEVNDAGVLLNLNRPEDIPRNP
jgi:molybdenum cofactor cytidylyltransferase